MTQRQAARLTIPILALMFTVVCGKFEFVPRTLLWIVDRSCVLDVSTTGWVFPCFEVDLQAGIVVLRVPFRKRHIVVMPTRRIAGIEDLATMAGGASKLLQSAWDARLQIKTPADMALPSAGFGLAINSSITRSQDQLHIHVDCADSSVVRLLSDNFPEISSSRWQRLPFPLKRQTYWVRRVDAPKLDGVDIVALANEIPALREMPSVTTLAILGLPNPSGADGFVLLIGQTDPVRDDLRSTGETVLDHSCGAGSVRTGPPPGVRAGTTPGVHDGPGSGFPAVSGP